MAAKAKKAVAMTIAGSDPGGGAGLQADLKTFAALNVYGFSTVTAIIAQNSTRVTRTVAVEADLVAEQIAIVVAERRPDSLKTGALASAGIVDKVADAIHELPLPAPVVDPVLISSSGARLLEAEGEQRLREALLPLARIVTPNIPEAEVLSGITIDGPIAMRAAAHAIRRMGARAVVITGGHSFHGAKCAPSQNIVDLLYDGRSFVELSGRRIAGGGAHGTGCAFSAAIAAYLARGMDLETAVRRARTFVVRAIRAGFVLGGGGQLLDHFARS